MLGIPIISSFNDKGVKSAERSFKSLENTSKKVSKTVKASFAAATAGVAAIGFATYDALKAAIEDQAAQAELARQLKITTKATDAQIASVEDWISTTALATGVADDQLRPALGQIVRATGSVTKAQKLLATAQNISAATGRPLAQTAKAVSQAYGGQFGALRKLSPEVAKLIKGGASTEQVFASLDRTFKGASDTAANTAAGKFQRFKIAVDELKEGVGAALLPIFTKLVDFVLLKILPAFEKLQKLIEDEGFLGAFEKLGEKLWDWIQPQIKPFLKKVGEFIEAGVKWLINVGLPKMVAAFKKLGQKFVDWLEPNIEPMLKELGKFWGKMVEWIITKGIPKLAALYVEIQAALLSWFIQLLPELISGLGKMFTELGKKMTETGTDIGNKIGKAIANGVISGLNLAIDKINDFIKKASKVPGLFGVGGLIAGKLIGDNTIPHIPALAMGGVVTQPTLALVGEAGPEAVVPLDRMGQMGGVNITIQTGVGDPVAIGREVARVLDAYSRRSGRAA